MIAPTPEDESGATSTRVQLYVAGDGPNSTMAIANVTGVLALHVGHGVHLEIVDVIAYPDRAILEKIFVTPMLVRLFPLPQRRILGTLADRLLLLGILGLPIGTE
jgi:circadian clock protein KaiB